MITIAVAVMTVTVVLFFGIWKLRTKGKLFAKKLIFYIFYNQRFIKDRARFYLVTIKLDVWELNFSDS